MGQWPCDLRIDPNFQDNSSMEWLLEDDADVVVTALMVRELGPGADPVAYGTSAARVCSDGHLDGPEAHWVRLHSEELRARGMLAAPVSAPESTAAGRARRAAVRGLVP